MQAVILAAGKGTRLEPLQTPKPLLKVAGKAIIEHTLSRLEGFEEVVVVVGHRGDELKASLKNKPLPFRLSFATQEEQLGTFHALQQAAPLLKESFLVMCGDDLYSREDIRLCSRSGPCILAQEVKEFRKFGILEVRGSHLSGIREKPDEPGSRLANTGLFSLTKDVLDFRPEKSPRGELELTDAVTSFASRNKVKVLKTASWIPIGYPWDLLSANEALLNDLNPEAEGEVEEGATLKNAVSIGKGTLVKTGAYIEGPVRIGSGCTIGPNCFIRSHTSIGDSCRIGNAVEIKNSILGDNVSVCHLSYLGDSVIGSGANIGGGTIAANLRHDRKTVRTPAKGSLVDTNREKMGCIIAEGVRTGIHTTILPGRKLDRDTLPGEVVK